MTSFGINNEGQLVFDYYHEDTDQLDDANVYNGQNSVLWTNFRQAYADEIKETYQNLRNNGLITYDKLVDRFITNGSDKWSETIYNEDMDFKYISMLRSDNDASNLPQVRGSGEEHFRYFVENRLNYCDSKWYASDYANDYISLRIYTPTTWSGVEPNPTITVTPFSDMYAGVRYKANGTLYQERATHGVPVSFSPQGETFESENNETFNDTETAVYGAHQLSSIGDLAPLYCGSVNVANADKLIELKVGDGTTGYSNNNLHELSVGTNKLLKKIDVQNCPNFTSVLDLSNCSAIEEVYAKGSSITGVNFPESGMLRIAQLPATLANFMLKHQLYVEELTIAGYNAIKTLWVENCPNVDGFDILSKSPNVERLRLTNVDLKYDTASEMLALAGKNIAGIDENGTNIDKMWIDGKCHIKALTGDELRAVKEAFPYLTITYDALTSYLTFMSEDGNTQLAKVAVQNGGDATYSGSTPTKVSTAQYNYSFAGWSLTPGGSVNANALKKVEADRTVYAAFSSTVRTYTVKFYSGTTLLQTVNNVPYGGTATYTGSTPTNNSTGNTADFQFYGWKPSPANIQGNTSCYAQFNDLREITDNWATIKSKVDAGKATYSVGAFKTLDIGAKDLPYNFYRGLSVVYNDEIHVLGSYDSSYYTYHYKWNGVEWVSVSTLPDQVFNGSVVVYNNEIHIFIYNSHYKWDGSSWTSVSTLPYNLDRGSAVVYNNEIHLLGSDSSRQSHYKWDGSSWTSVSTLPLNFYQGCAIVYNDEIHLLGSGGTVTNTNKHYKWDGSSWVSVGKLPFYFKDGSAVVYDDEIHILGSSATSSVYREHYKWDGSSWTSVSTLPYEFYEGSAVVFNDEIHILGSNKSGCYKNFYKFSSSTSTWSKVGITDSIPMQLVATNHDDLASGAKWEGLGDLDYYFSSGSAVVLNGEIHMLGGYSYSDKHSKWDGSTWTKVSTLPYDFYYGSAVVYNNEIHILGGSDGKTNHYKWNGTEWVSVSTLPYDFYSGAAVVYNNEIHILGSNNNATTSKYHYKWNGTEWTSVSTLSYFARGCSAVVYDNEIHILGGSNSKDHYKWNGAEWTNVSTLPYTFSGGEVVVYDNKIHIMGGGDPNYTKHYEWSGTEWISAYTLPYKFYSGSAVVYDNAITLLGSDASGCDRRFVKLVTTRTEWSDFTDLPYQFYGGSVVELNNEIHLLGGSKSSGPSVQTYHYKWDGTSWTSASTLPYTFYDGSAVVYNNEIHIFGGTTKQAVQQNHYKWNGSSWVSVSTLPYKYRLGGVVIYNNEIHLVGGSVENYHYKWTGTEWVSVSTLPYAVNGLNVVVLNSEIHIMGGYTLAHRKKHYKWTGTEWVSVSTLPYEAYSGVASIVYNNEIHLLGGTDATTVHYKWDGSTWTSVSTLPYHFYGGSAVVYDNMIHIFGTLMSSDTKSSSRLQTIRPKASLTFIAKNLLNDRRVMNTSATNAGGWSATELRAWLNGDFIPTLPYDLQTALTEVRKLSDDGGSGNAKIAVSHDKIWILSVSEITTDSSEDCVSGQGSVYSVFTDDNSRIRTPSNDIAGEWWTRSSKITSTQRFVNVTAYGSVSATGASNTKYILIGFCI